MCLPRAVKAWESGAYAPSMSHAFPLARVLGVPVHEVIEAVAGPDHEADRAQLPPAPAPLDEVAYHLAAATRLVQLLRGEHLSGAEDDRDQDPDRTQDPASPSGQQSGQEPGSFGD
jgi:hypothetical protein